MNRPATYLIACAGLLIAPGSDALAKKRPTPTRKTAPSVVRVALPIEPAWKALSAGDTHTCGIRSDGALYCWGGNSSGQCGNGESGDRVVNAIPVRIGTDAWAAVSAGSAHTCAIRADDRRLFCWGWNRGNQVGTGKEGGEISVPRPIGEDSWLAVSAGLLHTCGVKASDQRLYCWGDNEHGELGDATSGKAAGNTKPAISDEDTTWSAIEAGSRHTCGLRAGDGALFCWGSNEGGRVGDGAKEDRNVPTRVGEDAWSMLAVGSDSTCGLRSTDRRLFCWGKNNFGQIGDGTTLDRDAPTGIGEESWSAVSVGNYHACAIRASDGRLHCWGRPWSLAYGPFSSADSGPAQWIGEDGWLAVGVGTWHTCGIRKADGKVYCWGKNDHGQLGTGQPATHCERTPRPVTVP